MSIIRKYEFDVSFDSMRAPEPPGVAEPAAPLVEPTYSTADLAAAERRGYERGCADGEDAAAGRDERRRADALERVAGGIGPLLDQYTALRNEFAIAAADLTLLSLRKLFPAYLGAVGAAEARALIAPAFEAAFGEARLILRCPPALRETLEPDLRDAAATAGFEGRLLVIADDRLGPTDCRLEWAEGGIGRDAAALAASIEASLRRALPDPSEGGQTELGPITEPKPHLRPRGRRVGSTNGGISAELEPTP